MRLIATEEQETVLVLGGEQEFFAGCRPDGGEALGVPFDEETAGCKRQYLTPSLSTVNQQTVTMGEEAAKLFFGNVRKGNIYGSKPQKLVLEPNLICRQSSIRQDH